MDRKLFLQKLEQFAELKPIKPPATAKRRESQGPEVIQRGLDCIVLDQKDNETLSYQVKKLKTKSKQCQYCDNVVKDQIFSKRWLGYPAPHWREKCHSCNLTRNPETGEFELTDYRSNIVFTTFLRDKNK